MQPDCVSAIAAHLDPFGWAKFDEQNNRLECCLCVPLTRLDDLIIILASSAPSIPSIACRSVRNSKHDGAAIC